MKLLDIKYNPEQVEKIFQKYFQYEKKRELGKTSNLAILGTGVVLLMAGLVADVSFLVYIGIGSLFILSFYIITYLLRFRRYSKAMIKEVSKTAHEMEINRFGFNQEKIVRQTRNTNMEYKWDIIKNYEENDGDIYLYLSNRQLYDIISESLIGKEHFHNFRELLIHKTQRPS